MRILAEYAGILFFMAFLEYKYVMTFRIYNNFVVVARNSVSKKWMLLNFNNKENMIIILNLFRNIVSNTKFKFMKSKGGQCFHEK